MLIKDHLKKPAAGLVTVLYTTIWEYGKNLLIIKNTSLLWMILPHGLILQYGDDKNTSFHFSGEAQEMIELRQPAENIYNVYEHGNFYGKWNILG